MTAGDPRDGGWPRIAGDDAALHALWDAHRRWVAAILLAHKPREADLDDLLQEVAAIVVAKVGDVRDMGALRPWLRTVAISVARTAARKRARGRGWGGGGGGGGENGRGWLRRVVPLAPDGGAREDDQRPGHVEPGLSAAVQEEGRRLLELARGLPEGYREPLLLKCIRGLSYRQIGEMLGLPDTTVETRIARGRRMLREMAERAEAGAAAAATVAGSSSNE